MLLAASDLTGWWVGYGVGALVVVIVAVVVLALIVTARKIGDVAEDATRSLAETRDRTEVLWQVATTNQVATDILLGAQKARAALSGDAGSDEEEAPVGAAAQTERRRGETIASPPASPQQTEEDR